MKTWICENLIINGKLVSKRCKKEWFIKNGYIEKYNQILDITSFLNIPTFPQRIWHIINDVKFIKCKNPNCGNFPTFFSFTKGYLDTCSNICAQLNPDTIDKIKSTNLKKYGVEYGLCSEEIIEKRKSTCLEKYGVDNVSFIPEITEKKKKTCLKNYGTEWYLGRQDLKEDSIQKKYGVINIQKNREIKQKTTITRRTQFYNNLFLTNRLNNKVIPLFSKEEYINSGYYADFKFKCIKCNTEFYDCLEDGDIPRCTNCYKNSSIFEEEVYNFIQSITSNEIIRKNKTILSPLELDIYIPSKNVAFECNGLFWHGEINGGKNKKYHLNKTLECEKKNIKLIHVFEDEWLFKQEIVKSRIRGILNITLNKLFARKCVIKVIKPNESNCFLKSNHLQGEDKSSIRLGLYHNNELISVMTFGKLRTALGNSTKQNEWELYRFCSKLNTNVIGGASKLLSHFIKSHKPTKIVSYADKRWSVGNLYEKLGFKKVSDGTPNYWYFGRGNSYKRHHRFGFAKHTLSKKLGIFDPNLSEWDNMKNNKWDRIWDCGSLKFELTTNI